jgi:hypothetical protein
VAEAPSPYLENLIVPEIKKQANKQTNKHTERAPIVELRLNGVHVWQQRVAFGLGFSAEVSVVEGFGVIRFGARSSPQSH